MDAMVAERGTGMTEWNDGRLDDLSNRVGRIEKKMDDGFVHIDQRFKETNQKMESGFARLDQKMEEGFARIDAKFDIVNDRFDGIYQLLLRTSVALIVGLLGLLGVLIGTQS
jgi:hypothetical protein